MRTPLLFDGQTFDPVLDGPRLTSQLDRVRAVMEQESWMTLREIADRTGDPESSISARLRDLRKPKFGEHQVERRRRRLGRRGLWEYRCLRSRLF